MALVACEGWLMKLKQDADDSGMFSIPKASLPRARDLMPSIAASAGRNWLKRYFRIEGDRLFYYHAEPTQGTAKAAFSVALDDISAIEVNRAPHREMWAISAALMTSDYIIKLQTPLRLLCLKTASKQDYDRWLQVLRVHVCARRQRAGKSPPVGLPEFYTSVAPASSSRRDLATGGISATIVAQEVSPHHPAGRSLAGRPVAITRSLSEGLHRRASPQRSDTRSFSTMQRGSAAEAGVDGNVSPWDGSGSQDSFRGSASLTAASHATLSALQVQVQSAGSNHCGVQPGIQSAGPNLPLGSYHSPARAWSTQVLSNRIPGVSEGGDAALRHRGMRGGWQRQMTGGDAAVFYGRPSSSPPSLPTAADPPDGGDGDGDGGLQPLQVTVHSGSGLYGASYGSGGYGWGHGDAFRCGEGESSSGSGQGSLLALPVTECDPHGTSAQRPALLEKRGGDKPPPQGETADRATALPHIPNGLSSSSSSSIGRALQA